MTFQKIRTTLVKEKKIMSSKELTKFSIQLALAILGYALSLCLFSYVTLGFAVTVILLVLGILAYTWVFDYINENPESYSSLSKFAKFWWISYIILIIISVVLKIFHFL